LNTSDVIRVLRKEQSREQVAAAILDLAGDDSPDELLRVLSLTISLGAVAPAEVQAIIDYLEAPVTVASDPDLVAATAALETLEAELLTVRAETASGDFASIAAVSRDIAAMETEITHNRAELARLRDAGANAEQLLKELE
jgi:ribosomal protein L29